MTNDWPAGVHRFMHALADAAPPAPALGDLTTPPTRGTPPRRRLVLLALAPLVAATVAVLVVIAVRSDRTISDDQPTPTSAPDVDSVPTSGQSSDTRPTEMVQVRHDRIEITITYELECDNPIPTDGLFPTMTVDAYSDVAGRRWKNVVTYPDGSTRQLIAIGSAVYPSELWTTGTFKGVTAGCIGPDNESYSLGGEPAQNSFYSLNLTADLVDDEAAYVGTTRERGTQLEQQEPDLEGRLSTIWRWQAEGTGGYRNAEPASARQTSTWWVDPSGGETVTQYRFLNTVDGIGTAEATHVLVSSNDEVVPAGIFNAGGFDPQPTESKPALNGQTAFSTTTAPGQP